MSSPGAWLRVLLVCALVALLISAYPNSSASGIAEQDLAALIRLPENTFAFLTIRVGALLESPRVSEVLRQANAADQHRFFNMFRDWIGVDPRDLEQITFAVVFVESVANAFPVIHMRTKKAVSRKALQNQWNCPRAEGDLLLSVSPESILGAIRVFDDRSFVRGQRSILLRMQDQPPAGQLRRDHEEVLAILNQLHVAASVVPQPRVKRVVEALLREREQPTFQDALAGLAVRAFLNLESGQAAIVLKDQLQLNLRFRCADQRSARNTERLVQSSLLALQALLLLQSQSNSSRDLLMTPSVRQLLQECVEAIDYSSVARLDKAVEVEIATHFPAGLVRQALLDFLIQAPRSADRSKRLNQLRQIVLAMHNHHEQNNCLAANICDDHGRPLLSWRVALLPYLGHGELYQQFRLDEPWNSPHNRRLVEQMPAVYQTPGSAAAAGQTHYQVFIAAPGYAGRYTPLFSSKPIAAQLSLEQLANMDGTFATLCVVEARQPVIWTKPDDIRIDKDIDELSKPGPLLGALPDEPYFLAAFADASVRLLPWPLAGDRQEHKRMLRGLIGVQDQEEVDLHFLERGQLRLPSKPTEDDIPPSPPPATPPQ
jgi:hypothetical protein